MQTLQCHLDSGYESFLKQIVSISGGGLNVDKLYTEILFTLLHHRKFRDDDDDANESETDINDQVAHLKKVFNVGDDKHAKLLTSAEKKHVSSVTLNLEVVEAKGLSGTDVNGLSDPVCTVYVNPNYKENTSIKLETLSPEWREHFSFPISNVREDALQVEVWDYDPEERTRDKIRRISEVKSGKALKIFLKDLAKPLTEKEKRDSLGCLRVPLKDVPPEGIAGWFSLESRNEYSDKKKGEIHLKMGIGVQKEKKAVIQECQNALHFMLAYEIVQEQNIDPFQWAGRFNNKLSKKMLRTLQLQGGLTRKDVDLAQWIVYTKVHCEQHPLNVAVFPPVLEGILEHVKSQLLEDDELSKFWAAVDKLVENFVDFFRSRVQNQHHFASINEAKFCVECMLKTLQLIKAYLSENPAASEKESEPKISVDSMLDKMKTAISLCANEFFEGIPPPANKLKQSQIEHLVKVGQLLISDLQKCSNMYQNEFKTMLDVSYFDITYRVYDMKYTELVEPVLEKVCVNLKLLHLTYEDDYYHCQEEEVSIRTALFQLYLVLKQFANLSKKVDSLTKFCAQGTFHNWFPDTVVVQWLAIAKFKAINCIKSAIMQDNFQPLDDLIKITSSAVDTVNILHRNEIWNELSWPEVETSCIFISRILDDLARCVLFYADLVNKRIDQMENLVDNQYHVTDELCFAINNIESVTKEVKSIGEKVGANSTAEKFIVKNGNGDSLRDQFKLTWMNKLGYANESVNNKILRILEGVGKNMLPFIQTTIANAVESDSEDDSVEKLQKYLGSNLSKLNKKLAKSTFASAFSIIWENVLLVLESVIVGNIEKKTSPDFFQRMQKILILLVHFFYPESSGNLNVVSNSDKVLEIQGALEVHGASTSELIMKYCEERHKGQSQLNNKSPSDLGFLAVRTQYCEDIKTLKIELLNARNLKPRDSIAIRDSYVKITLVTKELVVSGSQYKSKIQRKTLFPWFDETFSVPLEIPPDEKCIQGILMFTLKDHNLLGSGEYIGDGFLPLNSVQFTTGDTDFKDLPQNILPLTFPSNDDFSSMSFQTLESRQWHKSAVEFVKRERMKTTLSLDSCKP